MSFALSLKCIKMIRSIDTQLSFNFYTTNSRPSVERWGTRLNMYTKATTKIRQGQRPALTDRESFRRLNTECREQTLIHLIDVRIDNIRRQRWRRSSFFSLISCRILFSIYRSRWISLLWQIYRTLGRDLCSSLSFSGLPSVMRDLLCFFFFALGFIF